jgi:hypothetical protein
MSTLKADTIVASDGTSPVTLTKQSAAKAWNSFNGTGTIAFINSFNGSSLVDSGTGEYDVNITNAMDSINYSILASNGLHTAHNAANTNCFQNTSSQYSTVHWENNGRQDITYMSGQIHGDLA